MNSSSKLKIYFEKSSIHGLPHITDKKKTAPERCFWVIICILASYATWSLLQATLYNYENGAISFIIDPDYLRFNTRFPTITVCEKDKHSNIDEAAKKIYGADRDPNTAMFLKDIAFFDGSCRTCKIHCKENLNCSFEFNYIVKTVRRSCSELIKNCSYKQQTFECCSEFLPLQTELGPCYSVNSANTVRQPDAESGIVFFMNRTTGRGILDFETTADVFLYLHSFDDVPTWNHQQHEKAIIRSGKDFVWGVNVLEITNDPLLKSLPINQRNCLFPDEVKLQSYATYSPSGCLVDCRARAQLKFCNCTHHFMPKILGVKTCDLNGLSCLSKYAGKLRNLNCNCTSSCEEPDYKILAKRDVADVDFSNSEVRNMKISVKTSLPYQRLKRVVVRTKLDLAVGMGSTIGLFLGASLLSTIEIPYFLFIRR